MGYLKALNSNDVIVTPFVVHKGYTFSIRNNNLGITYETASIGDPKFESIKHLFYHNYLSGSNGRISEASLPIRNPDGTITGEAYNTNYDNREQSSFELRYFPTGSDSIIGILSIPQKVYGNYIKPYSLLLSDLVSFDTIEDNSNFTYTTVGLTTSGNLFYKEGLILFTSFSNQSFSLYPSSLTGSLSSSLQLYETQYKCTIRANEFNYSLNPSLKQSGSLDQYQDFVTGSDFSPYVTTVGLYNDNQELLAVAKLAQPLPTSQTTDTTIVINLDR